MVSMRTVWKEPAKSAKTASGGARSTSEPSAVVGLRSSPHTPSPQGVTSTPPRRKPSGPLPAQNQGPEAATSLTSGGASGAPPSMPPIKWRCASATGTCSAAGSAGKTRSVCWRTSSSCQSEAIRGNQRQSEAITSVGLQAYVEQLPFGWQARAVQECAEGPGRTRALEVQRVPVGRGDGAPW